MYDLLLANGTLIDGTGAERRRADIGITGDRITAIAADLSDAQARQQGVGGEIMALVW